MATDMTFVDFVTPVPADWLNNVNTVVHNIGTLPPTSQIQAAITYTQTAPSVSALNTSVAHTSRYDQKNILDYGGVADGVTDNTAAFAAAVAACPPNRKYVFFPPGVYYFSTLVYNHPAGFNTISAITIEGCGQDVTELTFPAGSLGVTMVESGPYNSCHIKNMTITTKGAGGASAWGIWIQQTAAVPNPANTAQSTIENVSLRGSDGYIVGNYWTRAINITNAGNVSFISVFVDSYPWLGDGVFIAGSSTAIPAPFNFSNCTFNACNAGINYEAWTQGVSVSQCNFTGCNYGILAGPFQIGLDQLSVTGSQFNCYIDGIGLSSIVGAVTITNNFFLVQNNSNGIYMTNTGDFAIVGNAFNPASLPRTNQTDIVIDTWQANSGIITGNSFLNATTAVNLLTNSRNVNVQSNTYSTNSANVTNLGTGNTVGGGSA